MAAQDAELKLKVSLDLAFFKQQLTGLGQVAAGYNLPVQVKFDRRSVQNELNALGANIRRRNYRLEVKTNLDAEIKKAKDLADALNALPRGGGAQRTPGTIDKGFTQAALKGLGQDIKSLYKALGDAGLIEFNKAIANNKEKIAKELGSVGQDSIAGLLNGLASGNSQVKAAAASLGRDLISSIKSVLGIASPSKETGKLGKFAAEGFGKGFVSGMVQVERQMANAIRSAVIGALQEGLGKLPGLSGALVSFERQLAAGIQSSVRKAMREGLSASIGPGIRGVGLGGLGGGATGAALGGSKALAGAATAGMAKLGAGGMVGIAGQMGKLAIGDTSGLTNFIQESVAQAINAALSTGGQGALTGALAVGGVAGAIGFGGGFVNSLVTEVATTVRNRVLSVLLAATGSDVKGIVQVAVRDITNAVFSGILRQVRSAIADLPSIDWASTIPQRGIPANAFNRTLTGAGAPAGLPGTAFGAQKYLPTTLTNELKKVLADAANAFIDSLRQGIREVSVKELGPSISRQPLLAPGGTAQKLLPAAGGTTPLGQMRFNAVSTGATVGQPQVMRAPSIPPPMGGGGGGQPPGGGGGFGGFGGAGNFGRALGGINLPGSGAIRELGNEFAFAAKQVVLFGQAYKLLAFVQSFPGQVAAAVGQLQSFRNTLNAVTPSAEEARASNELLVNLMEKYNVPLQSARDGFAKLYASMAPAGFSGDEIRNIFTGITQAAATFGLSADKVDRVNYAFAQMASKGQVMSEELKGQLGDVLPGAMAIFAEAAGFKGPKAIQDFSEALEAGQFKGEAMVQLLKNVGIVMQKEFGPGAEGAARTFQGVINRLQNSLTLLYESFEPAAVTFLNSVVLPLTNGIKQVSDGFNAFFTGTAAKTAGGFAIAQELERLRPAFDGIGQNVQKLIPVFQQLGNVALGVAKIFLEIAGNPFVGYLLRAYVAVLPLTLAIQALNLRALIPLIASFLRAIPAFIAYTAATIQGVSANKALQLSMQLTGKTSAVTATQIRTVGLALKAAFASTVIGAALLGIGLLIEKIISLNASMSDTKAKALGAAQAIRAMSETEARQATRQYEAGAQSLKGLNAQIEEGKLKGKAWIEVTGQQAKALQDAGVIVSNVRGSLQVQPSRVPGAFQKIEGLAAESRYRERQITFQEQQQQAPLDLQPVLGQGEAGGSTKAAAAQSLESLENLRDQLAKARTEGDLERAKLLFEYQLSLDRRRFELQESAANDVQKAGIKLAKELFEIEADFRRQALESRQAIIKEEGSVAPGNLPPRAPKGKAPYGPITQFGAGANANLRIGQQVGGVDMQPRPVSGSERRDIVAAEKTQQTLLTERLRLEQAIQALTQKYAQTISTNFDTIFPVAQLKLQNELLAARYQLELQAVPKEAIDAQLAITEAEAKAAEQRKVLSQKLAESTAIVEKYLPLQEEGVKLTTEQSEAFVNAQGFISAYGSKLDEVVEKTRGFTEAQLENAIANIKQADSLKAIEETSSRINSAVEGATGAYKGLFKEIVAGTDAVDALKKAQEALADQALTLFLDFAFKPVEDFFKNVLGQAFGVPNEEAKRKETLAKLEAQLQEQKKISAATQQTAINTSPTGGAPALPSGQTQSVTTSIGNIMLPAGESVSDSPYTSAALSFGGETGPSATAINAGLFQGITSGLGDTSLTNQAQDFSKSLENVDSSLESVTASVQKTADETSESGKAGSSFKESLGKITQGIGIAASSILGIYAGISQIKEGGTGNVLSGIGSVLLSVAGGIGGIASLIPQSGKAANGAVWKGGFTAFANGGMVNGPTLGLIGEGRYNEAIVPLPNGRSIPVQFNGRTARDAMNAGASGGSQGLAIDMKFETTKINGVEYVSREQLEQAMAETRKKAARDGAAQGSQLALSKIKNSPNTRRQLGM